MKTIITGAFLLAIGLSISPAQEITTFGSVFPDYELSWHVEDDIVKGRVFIGKDYFGISTPLNQSRYTNLYKHYTISGEFLWTSANIVNDFWNITISRNGNRIIVDRKVYDNGKFQYSLTEAYNENGKHLFTSPKSGYLLNCSPNGIYFFSKPGGEFAKLILLDSNGELSQQNNIINLPSEIPFEGLAEAIDDSLLLIFNFESLLVFNMNTQTIKLQKNFTKRKYFKSHYSHFAQKIILWTENKVIVYDKDLIEISNFNVPDNIKIFRAQISNDSKTIALLLADLFDKTNPISVGFFNLDGNSIDQANYNFPTNEKIFTTGEISFDGKTYIHRYTGRNRITKEKLPYRSTIFTLDPETKKITAQFTINSWLYHTLKNDGFIEISDKYIKGWSRIN